jgi:hypothetical protein
MTALLIMAPMLVPLSLFAIGSYFFGGSHEH